MEPSWTVDKGTPSAFAAPDIQWHIYKEQKKSKIKNNLLSLPSLYNSEWASLGWNSSTSYVAELLAFCSS